MKRKIVLASQSPRRKQLLEQIGLNDFEVRESEYEEDMTINKAPEELVKLLALEKTRDVAKHYDDAIIIGGDTVIEFEGKVLGKPADKTAARKLLKKLSGNKNRALSGLAIIDTKAKKEVVDVGEAQVEFRKLSGEEIDTYISTGEPLEMAGGYGLMNRGAVLIKGIEGDMYGVIAFPLNKLYLHLKKLGVDVLKM